MELGRGVRLSGTCLKIESDDIVQREDSCRRLLVVSRCGGELKDIIHITHYLRRWSNALCTVSEEIHSHQLSI